MCVLTIGGSRIARAAVSAATSASSPAASTSETRFVQRRTSMLLRPAGASCGVRRPPDRLRELLQRALDLAPVALFLRVLLDLHERDLAVLVDDHRRAVADEGDGRVLQAELLRHLERGIGEQVVLDALRRLPRLVRPRRVAA